MQKYNNLQITNLKTKVPLASFLMSIVLIGFYIIIDYSTFKNHISTLFIQNSLYKIYEKEKYFKEHFKDTQNILYAIRQNELFTKYIHNKPNSKRNLKSLFKEIITANTWIMQLRYIDKDGQEQIRFDRKEAFEKKIFEIDEADLQNKSSRYYFTQNRRMNETLWFSELDLNIENEEIEIPFKPTYRVALPVVTTEFNGILIVNYCAQPLLDRLQSPSEFKTLLIDKDGYIIYSTDEQKQWSRFQENPFKIEEYYQQYLQSDFFNNENIAIKKFDLPLQNELYMILESNPLYMEKQKNIYLKKQIMVVSLYIIIMLTISFILFILFEKLAINEAYLSTSKKKQAQMLIQQAKMENMSEILSNIAHQWRQPLAIISLNTSLLERTMEKGEISDTFLQKHILKVNETLSNMSKTIEEFSTFFKPVKQKTTFNLSKIVSEAIAIVEQSLVENNIVIEFYNSLRYEYRGYKNELHQIILNIISNSKDAILRNSIEIGIIKVSIVEDKENYHIQIEDNGTGLSDDIIDKVFEPYFTTKFKDKERGIGLYMCKMVIENSFEGKIELKNKNEGACCTLVFPKRYDETL